MRHSKHFFHTLDGLRGIASLLVVLYHTGKRFAFLDAEESYLAVDVFFVMSGAVIANAYENRLLSGLSAGSLFWMRFVRLYPLYIAGCLLTVVALALGLPDTGPFAPDMNHVPYYLAAALFILPYPGAIGPFPLNIPAWSLFSEITVNVIYGASVRFLTRRNLILIMLFSAAGLAATLALNPHHNLNVGSTRNNFLFGFFRVGYSFFAGVLLFRLYQVHALKATAQLRSNSLALLLLAAAGAVLLYNPPAYLHPFYDALAVMVIFPAIVFSALCVQPHGATQKIFTFFGLVSYALYAVHLPLYKLMQALLFRFSMTFDSTAHGCYMLYLAVLVSLAWLLDKHYDFPLRRRLSALGRRPASP